MDDQEPSYYEIALTNRQVLVSFVVLLSCVLAAFVSGVWLGRKGSVPEPSAIQQVASIDDGVSDLDQLEEFKLLSEQREDGDLTEIVTEPRPGTTLAEDVGSSPPPSSPPPPRSSPPPPRSSPPPSSPPPSSPPPPVRRSSPPPPPPPPPASASVAPASKDGFVIQVFSTRDEAAAKRVLAQLRQGGYPAFLSPVKVGTQVNHRVRIGPYSTRPPAAEAAREVNSKYKLDTWITAAGN